MVKRVNDHIRTRILNKCGVCEGKKVRDLDTLRRTEWSPEFESLMRNRLLMGAFRYGSFSDPNKETFDCIGSIIERAKLYRDTGNDEVLVDIANLCLAEFVVGKHPLKHFDSKDDGIHIKKEEVKP